MEPSDWLVKRVEGMKWPLYCPHAPHARQYLFLTVKQREAMYGGAAGGGKSDALLMAALQYVDVPGYAALILRKSFADLALPDAIMSRAKAWLMGREGVTWNDNNKQFTFPSGATLTFGYLQTAADVYRYQGSAYQFIAFDELTQFNEFEWEYLLSRLRKPDGSENAALGAVPLRMRAASNPGGVGHDWVKARFIPTEDALTGALVYPRDHNGERRVFVPAKLEDNPSLDIAEYEKSLAGLSPVLRSQLRHGDWGARPPGEMFDRTNFPIVDSLAGIEFKRFVRAWDLASTEKRKAGHDPDYTVGTLLGYTSTDTVGVLDVRRFRKRPGETRALMLAVAKADLSVFGCRTIRWEQEPGSSGVFTTDSLKTLLQGFDGEGVRSTGPKAERAAGLSSWASSRRVWLLAGPWVPAWLSEYEAFPQDSVHDDQVDSGSLGFACLVDMYPATGGVVSSAVERRKNPYHANRRDVLARTRR